MSKRKNRTESQAPNRPPFSGAPDLVFPEGNLYVPTEDECKELWDKYEMLDNVRAHSTLVARLAAATALRAREQGIAVKVEAVHASGLLHDIAKSYCIKYGGGHAQLGASWVVQETGNYEVARGVYHHVFWPWNLPVDDKERICSLPFFVIYADKRAMHDKFVTLEERYDDLLERYAETEQQKAGIRAAYEQGKAIENAFSKYLGIAFDKIVHPEDILLHPSV